MTDPARLAAGARRRRHPAQLRPGRRADGPEGGLARQKTLKVAVDLNAVPPLGIEGIEVDDAGVLRDGVIVLRRLRHRQLQDEAAQGCVARLFETERPRARRRGDRRHRAGDVVPRSTRACPGRTAMPRVVGIDPGTVSIDVCGLTDGGSGSTELPDRRCPRRSRRFRRPAHVEDGPPDLIAGPSGYGLPLVRADQASEHDLRLALPRRRRGAGRHRRPPAARARCCARSGLPVVFTPGVIHLHTVPAHRKINRIDLGTADKVAAAALAIHDQADRLGAAPASTSLHPARARRRFTAAIAVEQGAIVDGIGGSSGPIGWQSAERAMARWRFSPATSTRSMLFRGGDGRHRGDQHRASRPTSRAR